MSTSKDSGSIRMLVTWGVPVLVVGAAAVWCERRVRAADRAVRRERMRERGRIARELHDAAGHRLLAIVLHARRLAGEAPHVRFTAETIEELARLTQRDVRNALGVLRGPSSHGSSESTPASRQVAGARSLSAGAVEIGTGLPDVDLTVQLDNVQIERELRPHVRHAALRIIQESITNAINHGGGPISVHLEFGDQLELNVVNGSAGTAANEPPLRPLPSGGAGSRPTEVDGRGLSGICERVAELGGRVEYGEPPGGGFRLRAGIPIRARVGTGRQEVAGKADRSPL